MSRSKFSASFGVLGAACMFALSAATQAQITSFADDFESYGVAGTPTVALFDPPWKGFSDNCGFPGGYTFSPSTSGPQISGLGYNGIDNQYWNTYGNYDNLVCQSGAGPNPAEEIFLYKEFSFTPADTINGGAWVFTFNYRGSDTAPPVGSTETAAYIRVFDPVFNILFETQLDTSSAAVWTPGKLVLPIDPGWGNGFVQIGFRNKVQANEDSGVFYDDVNFFQATANPTLIYSSPNPQNQLHPHHDGGPEAVAGLNDIIRFNVLGQSTAAGDPTDFDATQIVESTVRAFRTRVDTSNGLLQQIGGIDASPADGIADAQFRFFMGETGLTCDDGSAVLTGELQSGEVFSATGTFTSNCDALCHN